MKVLVVGSGGREHALGWALRGAREKPELLFAPGNGGTRNLGRNVAVPMHDLPGLARLAEEESVDFTLVGPEAPLAQGIVDLFVERGLPVFGPSARAAEIESSKVFSKTLLRDHGIPTAAFEVADSAEDALELVRHGLFPKVVKADGLAAGKGVVVARTREEAEQAVRAMMEGRTLGPAGDKILVETYLEGEEVSAFAIASGTQFRLLPLSQDHKRLGEGDTGPNTGGMGAYAPFVRTTPELLERIGEEVFAPTLRAMEAMGRPFRGLLYAGLMMVHGRPLVLEFNCRFGDPETQAVLPLLGPGLLPALRAVAHRESTIPEVGEGKAKAAATVVLASQGYPGDYRTGLPIRGVDAAEELPETFVFHAGTRSEDRRLLTAGGRVLAVTGRGETLKDALRRAYEGASLIEYEGKILRRDIGRRALA